MSNNPPTYSVVIPVYNSTRTLPELVERLTNVFNAAGLSHETIFVNDGSPNPETWPILKTLAAAYPQVRAFCLARNFGKAGAVLCGMQHARGNWIITIDDDLQHAPEDIPLLLAQQQHDVVMGSFTNRKKHTLLQRFGSRVKAYFDSRILGIPAGLKNSPFKVFRADVVRNMLAIHTSRPFIPSLMLYVTRDIVQVGVTHHAREHGKSAFTLRRRIRQFSNLIFGNSSIVLQAVAFLGISIAMLSLTYGGWLIIKHFLHGAGVPGWTSLMVVMLTLGGLTLFSIGVIGEYLIRIIEGIERRPAYFVREEV
ncbi:MAG: glycosyltransferase family 2 protein [Alphaproteobacteria bacterium]|nr:glycosyltransferase family 2 protein [Alphaproteobacteria bacterium]